MSEKGETIDFGAPKAFGAHVFRVEIPAARIGEVLIVEDYGYGGSEGGIPRDAVVSHKNGWVFDTVGDAGVVYSPNGRHYVISVFLWEETEFQDYEKLWPLVEAISRAAWNYFNPEAPLLLPRADLPVTAVECEGNYLPPGPGFVDLDDINGWRRP